MSHIRDDLVTIYRLINTVWTDKWHFLVYDNLPIARHRKKEKEKEKEKRKKKKKSQVRSSTMTATVITGWRRLIEIFSKISCFFSK